MHRNEQSGALLTMVAAIVAGLVAVFFVAALAASAKKKGVQRRWADTLGTKEDILAANPAREANPAALELERLSAEIGIDMATRSYDDRTRPTKGQNTRRKEMLREVANYSRIQLSRAERRVDAPPATAVAFLDEHATELEAIRNHLTSGDAPRWEMHLEALIAAPIPNLLGHIDMQKLLAFDALVAINEGRNEDALRDLDASWTLMGALWDDPILITQLITIADARMILGVLRQLPDVPPLWRERLRDHDFRESFTRALKFDAWVWTQTEDPSMLGEMGFLTTLASKIAKPYFDYCVADTSDDFRRRLENLEGVDALCDYDLASRDASLDVPIPRWNLVAGVMVPNLSGALDRLARLELDLELTARLLALEQARAEPDGVWPTSLPGGEASRACPRDRWTYETQPDGGVRLSLEREVSWPDLRGHDLPRGFTAI